MKTDGTLARLKQEAKLGNENAKKELCKYYYKEYYEYVELYSGIDNIDVLYLEIIINSVNEFIQSDNSFRINGMIKSKFMSMVKKYSKEYSKQGRTFETEKLVQEAITSKEARNKLLERYMYIVDSYLKNIKFDDLFTREDAYQEGCLFLIDKINNYFEGKMYNKFELSCYLNNAVRDIYVSRLRKEYQHINLEILSGLIKDNYDFFDDSFEFEWNDFVEREDFSNFKKEILKYLPENRKIRIAEELNCARQRVSQHVDSAAPKVLQFLKNK